MRRFLIILAMELDFLTIPPHIPLASMVERVWNFIGVFHPFLVHFPVGLLALAALVEAVRIKNKNMLSDQITPICLYIAAISAVAAVVAGLARADRYGPSDLIWNHKWGGIILAVITVLLAMVARRMQKKPESLRLQRAQTYGVLIATALLAFVGHWGAQITHGEGYLSRAWDELWNESDPKIRSMPVTESNTGFVDFPTQIWPILESRCIECHGETKSKAGLRLHTKTDAMGGGEDGAVIVPGSSAASKLIERLRPEFPEDIMPPEQSGKFVTQEEYELIRRWIDEGANWPR